MWNSDPVLILKGLQSLAFLLRKIMFDINEYLNCFILRFCLILTILETWKNSCSIESSVVPPRSTRSHKRSPIQMVSCYAKLLLLEILDPSVHLPIASWYL